MNNSNVQRNLEILDAFNDILSYIQHNKKDKCMKILLQSMYNAEVWKQ